MGVVRHQRPAGRLRLVEGEIVQGSLPVVEDVLFKLGEPLAGRVRAEGIDADEGVLLLLQLGGDDLGGVPGGDAGPLGEIGGGGVLHPHPDALTEPDDAVRVIQPAGLAVAPGTAALTEVTRDGLGSLVEGRVVQFRSLAEAFGQYFVELCGVYASDFCGDLLGCFEGELSQCRVEGIRQGRSRSFHTDAISSSAVAACAMTSRVTARPGGANCGS